MTRYSDDVLSLDTLQIDVLKGTYIIAGRLKPESDVGQIPADASAPPLGTANEIGGLSLQQIVKRQFAHRNLP